MNARAAALILTLALAAFAGCSKDDGNGMGPNPVTPSSSFTGLFAVSGFTDGKVTLSISSTSLASPLPRRASRAAAHEITAIGTLAPRVGSPIALSGTYSDENDSLHVSGGGYTLIGHYDDSVNPPSITGSLNGPQGEGLFGCFGGSTPVKVYCGGFTTDPPLAEGTWSMVTIDTALVGVMYWFGSEVGDVITFSGTVERTGTTRAIEFSGGEPGVLDLTGTGSLDTATNGVSGSWAVDYANEMFDTTGVWNGGLCP